MKVDARTGIGILTEAAVVTLSVTVAFSLERLFVDRSFLGDVITIVIVCHGVAIAARHIGLSMWVAAPLNLLVTATMLKLILYSETLGSAVFARGTWNLLGEDLRLVWDLFQTESAPVEPIRGFVMVAAAALGVSAPLADWAAFRSRSFPETIAPAATVFAFTTLLSSGDHQIAYGAAFAGAVAFVAVAMRMSRRAHDEFWIGNRRGRGIATTAWVGGCTVVVAVASSVVVAPSLFDRSEALVDVTDIGSSAKSRSVASPLVEIAPSIVEQSNFELFSVKVANPSTDRHYWRLMALTDFDGGTWSRRSRFRDAHGPVPADVGADVARRVVRQQVTTRRLGNVYLPAAYELAKIIDSSGVTLEYEAATAALVVDQQAIGDAARGFTYVIESAVPAFNPNQLPVDATTGSSSDFVDEYTRLPRPCGDDLTDSRCWPASVTTLAESITREATTDYGRVRALQDFFVGSESDFVYDLDVAVGHDINSVTDFLFNVRRGYCEQFAATYAAMARSLGIPARVAVGYTWGEFDEERGEFVVKGKHAHAWPEVHFSSVGWISFDPTPGRAPTHGTNITGLQPAQDGDIDSAFDGEDVTEFIAPPSTVPFFNPDGAESFEELADPASSADAPGSSVGATEADNGTDSGSGAARDAVALRDGDALQIALRTVQAVLVAVAIASIIPVTAWLLRRRRFKLASDDPGRLGEFAFDVVVESVRLLGIKPIGSETPAEFGRRVLRTAPDSGPITEFIEAVTRLRYAHPELAPHSATAAWHSASLIRHACRSQVTPAKKLLAMLNPRSLRVA